MIPVIRQRDSRLAGQKLVRQHESQGAGTHGSWKNSRDRELRLGHLSLRGTGSVCERPCSDVAPEAQLGLLCGHSDPKEKCQRRHPIE